MVLFLMFLIRKGAGRRITMGKAARAVSTGRSRTGAQPTIGGSTYVKPQDMDWAPTQFAGVSIKVLYEDKDKGEMTCLLKWAPGTSLPMHKHPEIEQTYTNPWNL
jgi:hypothetical protein